MKLGKKGIPSKRKKHQERLGQEKKIMSLKKKLIMRKSKPIKRKHKVSY